jgi:uncharacterized repeat protein (TIGR03803 family)
MTPSGTLTTLHTFGPPYDPVAGLVQGTNGDFYGTTTGGGLSGDYGTVFRITPSGTLKTLHKFDFTDGANVSGGLLQANDGNFYGTTKSGGTYGYGTVFVMTASGALTTLHSFDETDGELPFVGLVQANDGNFYGTTAYGGATNKGTVFRITPSGTLTTLYSFCAENNCPDGSYPDTPLVQDTNGDFYGATFYGGGSYNCYLGCGTIFSLSVGLGPFVATQPTSGKVGAAVKILGSDLAGATSVTFNGTAAVFKVVSTSEITTTVPLGARSGKVQVVTPGGTRSSNVFFRVRP